MRQSEPGLHGLIFVRVGEMNRMNSSQDMVINQFFLTHFALGGKLTLAIGW